MFYFILIGLLVWNISDGIAYYLFLRRRNKLFKKEEERLLNLSDKYFHESLQLLDEVMESRYETEYMEWILVNYKNLSNRVPNFKEIVGDFDGALKDETLRRLFVSDMTRMNRTNQKFINELNMYFGTDERGA